MKWIPVGESLPKTDEYGHSRPVLISLKETGGPRRDYVSVGRYRGFPFNIDSINWGCPVGWAIPNDGRTDMSEGSLVIAWMPLPEPYKGGDTHEID